MSDRIPMPEQAPPIPLQDPDIPAQGPSSPVKRDGSVRTHAQERRDAILKALAIISSVSRGLYVPDPRHGNSLKQLRLV